LSTEVLTGELAEQNVENVKRWLRGIHTWTADGATFGPAHDAVPDIHLTGFQVHITHFE